MKTPNTNRVIVGSDKGLTDLQEKINSLNSKGILKGYEAQGGFAVQLCLSLSHLSEGYIIK